MVGGKNTSLFPQRARAARPKAMPAKAFTPTMEPADLEEEAAAAEEFVDEPAAEAAAEPEPEWLAAGVVAVVAVAGEEPLAEEDAPVAAAVVADPVGRSLNVTP